MSNILAETAKGCHMESAFSWSLMSVNTQSQW